MTVSIAPATLKAIAARVPQVAIDGPSGSGKSTIAKALAGLLGGDYVDTGAAYRAMTWWMVNSGVDIHDEHAVAEAADSPIIDMGLDPSAPRVWVDSRDVSGDIRSDEITAAVSSVARVPQVRRRLVDLQRSYAMVARSNGRACVMEGRDIGTVVLPTADLKVWLTADLAARAQRRAAQNGEVAEATADASHVAQSLARRDQVDSTREASPAQQAADALVVDATDIGIDDVVRICVLALCDSLDVSYA